MIKKALFLAIAPLSLFCNKFETNFQSFYNADFVNKSYSHLCVDFQAIRPNITSLIILNPKFRYYWDNSYDISYSTGARFKHFNDLIGYHLFFGRSKNECISFWQSGISLELLRNTFDLRYNFYLPFPKNKIKKEFNWKSIKWNEIELTNYFNRFQITSALFFDLEKLKACGRLKFTIPFQHNNIFVGVNINQCGICHPFAGLSIIFYKFKYQNEGKPISYSQRVWCHGTRDLKLPTFNADKNKYKLENTSVLSKKEDKKQIKQHETIIQPEDEKTEHAQDLSKRDSFKGWWEDLLVSDQGE